MSWSSRRALFALSALVALVAIPLVGTVLAQKLPPIRPPMPGDPPGKGPRENFDLGSLVLPRDDELTERVEAAADNIKRKNWEQACKTLQRLVIREGDIFVPLKKPDAMGKETDIYVSVKREAARMLGSMPKEGRDFYEATFGPGAAKMVKHARDNSDFQEMALAASIYLYTEAGAEACAWLGTYMLDRAEFQGASRFYGILIGRSGIKAIKNNKTLLKAAYAFNAAGDAESRKSRDLVLDELKNRGVEVKLRGDAVVALDDLRAQFDKMVIVTSQQSASDSNMYRSRGSRTAMLPGGTPFLEPLWKKEMAKHADTKGYLRTAEAALSSRLITQLSAFSPVTATISKDDKKRSLLVYRDYWGIRAVDMADGKQMWDSESDWSFDSVHGKTGLARDENKIRAYNQWVTNFNSPGVRPQILFENSVLGTLSTDNKHVYAVEDLAVPAPATMTGLDPRFGGYNWGPVVTGAMQHNRLMAYSLTRGGRLIWDVGSREAKDPLGDTYFMSAPLPLNNKLYVLGEKQQELRLITLDPAGDGKGGGKAISIQPLASTKDIKLVMDPLRRTQAAHLAYAEGILVVPTNAGAVFGVDTLANSLLWAYPYREAGDGPPKPPMGGPGGPGFPGGPAMGMGSLTANWQVTAPAISEGKVVFTAPDGRNIHCISLRDGTRQWAAPREDGDLYLAGVFGGKVVIVGEKSTRALSLTKGQIVWRVDTGLPSGQGAASNSNGTILYYLPVRTSLSDRKPEIVTINVDKGFIHAHTRSRKGEVPGNLLFFEGNVLSQSQNEVVAYPQLEVQLARLDKEVTAEPNNPDKLAERGDYLLDKGDLAGAIADLRKAVANKPSVETGRKARGKLYEAFTEYFQRDFAKAEGFLKEYEEMTRVDLTGLEGPARTEAMEQERRRKANFLCLVGKGRESQNRLVDAFEKYLALGTDAKPDELIQVVDEPSVKAAPDVWSQGRIAAMIRNAADARQKEALESLIKSRWAKVKTGKTDDLRKFVALFGSLFGVGREARFALVDKLMEDPDLNSLLEAEQHLTVLRGEADEQTAAQAIEALARLNTRKGLLEDAAFYYRVLGEKYPNIKVDGKKGSEHLEDLATDKRFLPYLGADARFKIQGKVELRKKEERGAFGAAPVYPLANLGDQLPYFARHKIGMKLDWTGSLEINDTSTGDKRSRALDRTNFQQFISLFPNATKLQFGFQNVGHAIVVQMGHRVFGIDPLGKEPRVLWSENLSLLPGSDANPPAAQSQTLDARDGAIVVTYSDGAMQRLGVGGPLTGGVVCLLRRDSLTAIDPITGRKLWVRTDVTSRSHIFGDGQNVYVVALDAQGNAAGTRAFRAYDGVSVKIKDFSTEFDGRQRIMGRTILSRVTNARNETTLSVYDIIDGKPTWKQEFAAGAIMLDSATPELAGAVNPATGEVKVVNLNTLKTVLDTKLKDPKHAAGAQMITLASDRDYIFLAVKQPDDPNVVIPWAGGVQSCLQPGYGMRSVPVNGMVYAYRKADGKVQFFNEVNNAHLVLTGLEDAPALHFNSRYQKWVGAGVARTQQQVQQAMSFAKHNGKMWYNSADPKETPLPFGMNILEYTTDQRTGQMTMVGGQVKVTMYSEPVRK